METIKKRSIIQFALLDILTFGIYGIFACNSMGKDIDRVCEGDGEQEISYIKAWLLGLITFKIYEEYWWYRQANRMKYNAGRYNLQIRESGLSLLAFRASGRVIGILVSIWKIFTSFGGLLLSTIPILNMMGSSSYGYGSSSFSPFSLFTGGILAFFVSIIMKWVRRAFEKMFIYIGLSFVVKNLNRYSDAYEEYEALPFDPMGYEYYDALCNRPMGALPDNTLPEVSGTLIGMQGTNEGYSFKLEDGKEVIIGKNTKIAHIIIDVQYTDVSRKHCGITYLSKTNEYMVTDYSQYGVFYDGGIRIPSGTSIRLPAGTVITLAKSNNKFRLG